ncbi:sulfurtransferase TusA family protein [Cellulomonas sp. KRMCY2]|uniref:sulfurtransferase TusA family protein n=1 Tax=Cellulomonas sp. KRMCY2 TaxID=1304865 RepID=UPI00045EA5A0|nr:sulfurtransferase TusA family protein [Cellulomonas sp. KRMCY2]
MTAETVVDARGLRCPLPVIRAAAAARGAPPGSLVTILWTDPAARHDLPAWARMRGHALIGTVAVDTEPADLQPDGGSADRAPGTPPAPVEAFATTIRIASPAG